MPTYAQKMEHPSTSYKSAEEESELTGEELDEPIRDASHFTPLMRLSSPKIKKGHWLDLYRQQVASLQNHTQEHAAGNSLLIKENVGNLAPLDGIKESGVNSSIEEDMPISVSFATLPAVQNRKKHNFFERLFLGKSTKIPKLSQAQIFSNQGTASVGPYLMRRQIKIGNIVVHQINGEEGPKILKNIAKNPKENDFIFALSKKKGLRILEKSRITFEYEEEAFHHQNIFMNDNDIITAGTVFIENGEILFTNFSGHFKPPYESLMYIKNYFENIGIKKIKFKTLDYRALGKR